ncbi:hypothetical protein G9A89_014292 [Geosiphon pyriformis]|nr:hypothetical protein G9A89_014292 [Geosiphon pyriformis]
MHGKASVNIIDEALIAREVIRFNSNRQGLLHTLYHFDFEEIYDNDNYVQKSSKFTWNRFYVTHLYNLLMLTTNHLVQNESYTSKTCCQCGNIQRIGGSEVYNC